MENKPIRNRFTVLELICVIAGVVLIMFLVPSVIYRNREKARRSNCAGNLKGISYALLSYSGDYGGFFPPTPENNSFVLLTVTMDLPDSKAYDCPSHKTFEEKAADSDYWYVGSGVRDDVKGAKHVVLGYDMFGNHPRNKWMNVMYVDGHVGGGRPGKDNGLFDNSHAVRKTDGK